MVFKNIFFINFDHSLKLKLNTPVCFIIRKFTFPQNKIRTYGDRFN